MKRLVGIVTMGLVLTGAVAACSSDDGTAPAATDDAGTSDGGNVGSEGGGSEAGIDAGGPSPDGGGTVARPSTSKGTGFFVVGSKLYDANGVEFRVRGIDKLHWDNPSAGLALSKANTVRWTIDFTRAAADNVTLLRGGSGKTSGTIYDHMVVMPGMWTAPAGDLTCKDDPALVVSAVDTWIAQASAWNGLEKYLILNIANEWGPSDSTVWRDTYVTAIGRLRAAGIHATISVTSGGCGQDNADLVKYAKAVFDSDPEKNVVFDRHVYGDNADVASLETDAAALETIGVPILFGEFGPGRNIGPSPTNLAPVDVIKTAEKHGFGWMAWAWDDNNLANAESDNTWFSLSYKGTYASSADLTIFGQQVVEGCSNPAPGGCGCPDAPAPANSVVAPGCKGVAAPTHVAEGLSLAVPATIF